MKTHETPSLERIINKVTAYAWLAIGIGCLCGVVFRGAWWHLFTAAICLLFYAQFKHDADIEG